MCVWRHGRLLSGLQGARHSRGQPGDVVLCRTGWNSRWKDYAQAPEQREKDRAEFNAEEPGVSLEVCDSLATRKIAMMGSDTWGREPMESSKDSPESFAYGHRNHSVRRGISNFEHLDLDVLSQEKV